MAVILRLEKRKMPAAVKNIFEKVESGTADLLIPAMVLAEIGYLSEKKRISASLLDVKKYLKTYSSAKVIPLSEEIIFVAFSITDIPELHDRIIAATAAYLNENIVTNDPIITRSKSLKVVW